MDRRNGLNGTRNKNRDFKLRTAKRIREHGFKTVYEELIVFRS